LIRVEQPRAVIPRHVAACQHSPFKHERWFIWTWSRNGSSQVQTRIPYSCDSWRCEVCRRHEAAVTFARIKEAAEPLDPSGWCFLVVTLDRDGYYGGSPWQDVNEAYRSLGSMTRALLSRIGRIWGPETALERGGRSGELRTVRKLGNRWVGVVEAHRSGWPHVNLLVWCPELAARLRADQAERLEDDDVANAVELARDAWRNKEPLPRATRELARRATVLGGELLQLATDSGWGLESTAEAARSADAVAGYLMKLAGLHDASVGELAKITQAPTNAPERFRRLRSGRGFLPPRRSNPEITGCLVRRRRAGYSRKAEWRGVGADWEIEPINPPKDIRHLEPIARARAAEWDLIAEEERILSRSKGRGLPAMPPVRLAVAGKLEGHRDTSERNAAMLERAAAVA
jgi:hypothetical protein